MVAKGLRAEYRRAVLDRKAAERRAAERAADRQQEKDDLEKHLAAVGQRVYRTAGR